MRARNAQGSYIVEALVSVLIASLLSSILIAAYAETRRASVKSQGQLMAVAIAQEVIDELRVLPYQQVAANLGVHTPVVNGTPQTYDPLFPRPLLQDTGTFTYGAAGPSGNTNVFHATNNSVSVDLTPGQQPNTIEVQVTIVWVDSSGKHTMQTGGLLVQDGLNG